MRLSGVRKTAAQYLTMPIVRLLARTPVTPNALSWLGFFITVGAGVLIATGHLFAAGLVVLFAGFLDTLDGALARSTNRTTPFGGILDSTLDRLSEAALLLGILARYAGKPSTVEILLVGLALIGSLLVSYLRARAEVAGLECQVGIFTRPERVIVLALGLLLNQLLIALTIIVVLSFVTAGQRLIYIWREMKSS